MGLWRRRSKKLGSILAENPSDPVPDRRSVDEYFSFFSVASPTTGRAGQGFGTG